MRAKNIKVISLFSLLNELDERLQPRFITLLIDAFNASGIERPNEEYTMLIVKASVVYNALCELAELSAAIHSDGYEEVLDIADELEEISDNDNINVIVDVVLP